MLHKVLWKNRSRLQIVGASIGVFIGLFLLLLAMQVYLDMQILMSGARDSNILIINKSFDEHLMEGGMEFSEAEIEELRNQPFFTDIGLFESNEYGVYLESEQLNFATLLFFQSIPGRFIDIDTSQFYWKGEGDDIPIVLSSDYLALYNFGLAQSQGLPTMTVETIGAVDFKITITGKGKQKVFNSFVFDLSHNVNSILVPPEFLEYSNREFGSGKKPPSQVIASTDNPYSRSLTDFLDEKKYEISRGGLIGGELRTTLNILIILVIIISLIIIGLSLLVFILNFQLLIAQASQDIRLLIQVGYRPQDLIWFLARRLFILFGIIVASVFISLLPTKYFITQTLITQGYNLSSLPSIWVWLLGLIFCALFVWLNFGSIRTNVQKLA